MKSKPNKQLKEERVTIRLEPDVKKALEKMATAADKPLAHFIRSELKKIAAPKLEK